MKRIKHICLSIIVFTLMFIFIPINIKQVNAITVGQDIVEYAKQFKGLPYVSGGMHPSVGFDCSGLTYYVYGQFGYDIGRTTYDQVNVGKSVAYDDLKPGDLVFMLGSSYSPKHVGIYVGNGQVIHSPGTGRYVTVENIYHFVNAKRIIKPKYNCWEKTTSGYWKYYDANGEASIGWKQIKWNGIPNWFYFDKNGVMCTGWHKAVYDGGIEVWYYLSESGAMVSNSWYKINYGGVDKWFYFNENGTMITGWHKINYGDDEQWFYFEGSGIMATGWCSVNDQWYYFNGSGVMVTGWHKINYNGQVEDFYFNPSGSMVTGWQNIKCKDRIDRWFYFNENGVKLSNTVIDGYELDENGIWHKG